MKREAFDNADNRNRVGKTKRKGNKVLSGMAGILGIFIIAAGILQTPVTEESAERDFSTVVRVVDGDTLIVELDGEEEKLRLIGVNAPESVHNDESRNNEYGEMASDYLKACLPEGTNIWIEWDEERYDQYDRLLGYVWIEETSQDYADMVNYNIIEDGYGINVVFPPNTRYADVFESCCDRSIMRGNGLWQYPEYVEMLH